jgi:hypothetical protein
MACVKPGGGEHKRLVISLSLGWTGARLRRGRAREDMETSPEGLLLMGTETWSHLAAGSIPAGRE